MECHLFSPVWGQSVFAYIDTSYNLPQYNRWLSLPPWGFLKQSPCFLFPCQNQDSQIFPIQTPSLFFHLTQNKNILNNLDFNSNPKKLELPLEKDEFTIKNEINIIENKVNLDSSLKGTNITIGNQQIILITAFITINNKCPTDNCFDCYTNQEINYPELSEEEAFHKTFYEKDPFDLHHTFLKGIYYNPKMTKEDNRNPVYSAWNKYKRKMVNFKGVNYIDKYNVETYNSEYIQANIQGYEFTIIDHIYEKIIKNINIIYNIKI